MKNFLQFRHGFSVVLRGLPLEGFIFDSRVFLLSGSLHELSTQLMVRTVVGEGSDKLLDAPGFQLRLERKDG